MKLEWLRWILYITVTEVLPFGLLQSADGVVGQLQDCSSSCSIENYWCDISPRGYAQMDVSEGHPGRIVCTIPYTTGQDILVVNQFGVEVRLDSVLSQYVQQVQTPAGTLHTNNRTYHLDVHWPADIDIQDKLRLIQCIAIFHGTTQLCRTSVVNLRFINERVTTSTSGSTTANSETFTDNSETTTTSNSRSVADLRTDTTTASSSLITTKCINVLPQNSANQTLKVSLSLVAFILSLSMALYLL